MAFLRGTDHRRVGACDTLPHRGTVIAIGVWRYTPQKREEVSEHTKQLTIVYLTAQENTDSKNATR